MPNTETVRALVSAFNVHNYARNTVKTNFTLQSRYGEDCIVVSFDKGTGRFQRSRYLGSIKRKIVGEFYGIEEGDTDEVVLNTANLIFNIQSFPFNTSKGKWSQDEQGRIEFLAPIDEGVIFNLKSHLASSLKKDVLEDMSACRIVTKASDKKDYLWHGKFPNKNLRGEFGRGFLSRMRERYENVPKNLLKVKGNSVYIRDVFDDVRFIDSVTQYIAWLKGMGLQDDSKNYSKAKAFKDLIVESIGESTGVIICGFVCASPLNRKEASILIPLVLDSGRRRVLTKEEALELNYAFNYAVLNDLYGRTQGGLLLDGSSGVYGIDFSNKEISHCVITKIIESSVINKDHELAIDPGRGLLPAQSPFNSPMHAGPSGLRTPPNQRKKDTDSGYDSSSPPKPKYPGDSSDGPGPSTKLSGMKWESPTHGQVEELKRSIRQESEKKQELHNPVNLAGPSEEFPPSPQLSSSGPSSWKGANESVETGRSIWYASLSHSPDVEDVRSIFIVEPEKQQVSGECSEAESQESESPKKRKGGFLHKGGLSTLTNFSPLKRRSVERDTMCSSKSDLVHHVTKEPPVSKPFSSFPTRIKAKSNPPSGVTSCEGKESQLLRLAEVQLSSPDNSSSKKVDRDGGFCSMGSPAVPHKGSVSSECKECSVQQVKYMSKALEKD